MEKEFGTGALKITPGHDPTDFEVGKAAGLSTITIMNKDATLNENAGAYAGVDRVDARKRIWADLQVGLQTPGDLTAFFLWVMDAPLSKRCAGSRV